MGVLRERSVREDITNKEGLDLAPKPSELAKPPS